MHGRKRDAIAALNSPLAIAMTAASMLIAVPLAAQDARAPAPTPALGTLRTIDIGETVQGELAPGAPSESRFDDYRIHLNAGDAVQIDLEAEFDTYLELRRAGQAEPVDSNDDRGDSLNSRIVYTAPAAGDYIIHATRLYSGDGPYTLRVSRVTAVPHATLEVGQTPGAFDSTTPMLVGAPGPATRQKLYDVGGAPGERVQIEATSTLISPRLELLGPDGTLLLDDGGGSRRTARLIFVLARNTSYTVRVTAPAAQPGPFTLNFRKSAPAAAAAAVELRRGVPVFGRFEFDSPAELAGASQLRYFYRDFTLPVRRGEVLTLDMLSRDFDPYIEVGVLSPVGFAIARRDDDSGEGLNAHLVLRPDSAGLLTVRARSTRPIVGCYTLRVTPGENAPPAATAAGPATSAAAGAQTQPCPSETPAVPTARPARP